MEIGIHAPHMPEFGDWGWVREVVQDIGFTWAKIGGPYIEDPQQEPERFDEAIDFITNDLGLKLVIDLRTTPNIFHQTVSEWRQSNREFDPGEVLSHILVGAAFCVERWGSVCKDWEFWGEYA